MKFNDVIDERAVWAIIKSELGVDGPVAHELTRLITAQLKRSCESALRMDRVELREELEKELVKKYEAREEALKKREEAGGGMTREELIRILKEQVVGENGFNAQAAKLLTDLEGFKAAEQDITVYIISYEDAPDWFHVIKPEPIDA